MTFGSTRSNITLSPGYNRSDGFDYLGFLGNLSLGISNQSRFVVDFLRFDGVNLATVLYEYVFKGGFSMSLGAILVEDAAIPNFSFSVPFGKWKSTYVK